MLDMNCLSFDVKLIYDTQEGKEVDFLKLKPLEYKVKVDSASIVNIECRLKVLTRQLEDMFFRLRFVALDPLTKTELSPQLIAVSQPIKVISKPEQLRKTLPASHKRKTSELVCQSLEAIENEQKFQREMLEKLREQIQILNHEKRSAEMQNKKLQIQITEQLVERNDSTDLKPIKDDPDESLESSFQDLMVYFESIRNDMRSKKMKLAIQTTSLSKDFISEFVDLFSAQGLRKPSGVGGTESVLVMGETSQFIHPLEECHCQHCPHKDELKRISEFYHVFSL